MNTIYALIHDKDKTLPPKVYYEENKMEFARWNAEGWGVYFSANQFKDKKRTKEDCVKLRYVFADLDVAKQGDGKTQKEIDAKKEKIILALQEKLPPTYIIDTKNGIQPLWQLDKTDISRREEYENVIKGIIKWSLDFGSAGDAVQDCARILRKPDFYHQKGEPYMCKATWPTGLVYTLDEIKEKFPYEEIKPVYKKPVNYNPNRVYQAIDNLDFQELIVRAFSSVGRNAEFDKTGRLVLDGRLTGTFQGRKETRDYLASSSHESFKGNKVTAVADILQGSNKDAMKWIISEYGFNFDELEKKEKIKKQLESIKVEKPRIEEKQKRYTWGTYNLDHSIVILKRGNLAVLGAKRNMGKTTFTFDMACKNAKLGHKVLYVSLEMEKQNVIEALSRNYAGITVQEEYDYNIPEKKLEKMKGKMDEIEGIKNLKFEGIRRGDAILWDTVKKLMDENTSDLIFIDNLDLIASDKGEEEMTKQKRVISNLMSYTTEKNVPVILIHHYRKGKQGVQGMDELAGSGKIADGADILINLSRRTIEESIKDNVGFPESNKTVLWVQKGRGYADQAADIYFVEGTFYDIQDIPTEANHRGQVRNLYLTNQAKVK